jgi:hypothetical protein
VRASSLSDEKRHSVDGEEGCYHILSVSVKWLLLLLLLAMFSAAVSRNNTA